ncbi:Pleckstrin homology domain-containing protein [Limtongia smithiae]|uniref:Pleckstrin homology domain-containing protein n=1 Tax=Limtongia smithiae TaxID=1125753 RepID=UPI0034CEEBD1
MAAASAASPIRTRGTEGDHASPDRVPVPLDCVQFTSFRLSHASPSHMHSTSRSVLIGPIPSDWLRRHQKVWLARIARSSDQEFKQAWSSTFPDSSLPSHPPPTLAGVATAAVSLRGVPIGNNNISSSVRSYGTSIPRAGTSPRSIPRGSLSQYPGFHDTAQSTNSSPGGQQQFHDASAAPLSTAAGASSISSSRYHEAPSHFSTPAHSPMLSPKFAPHNSPSAGTVKPFQRYSDGNVDFAEIPRSLSRGRLTSRFPSSGYQGSAFAPSSYTSTQSFRTARAPSSVSDVTETERSRSRSRRPSPSAGAMYTRRSVSHDSVASTLRPLRPAGTSLRSMIATSTVSDAQDPNRGQIIVPQFNRVQKNAAKSSLATILQRDAEVRRQSRSSVSDSHSQRDSDVLSRRRLLDDDDEDEHGSHNSDNDSLQQLDFNFLPERVAHHNEDEVYDVVVDGASILGAMGPELATAAAGSNSDGTTGYQLKPGQIVKIDRVLIVIKSATVRSLPSDYNESDHTQLNSVERAREYVVAARYTGDDAVPFVLQFYKTLTIPAIDNDPELPAVAYTIPLDRRVANVSIFSSLDKSLALWQSVGEKSKYPKTMIYILRFRAPSASIAWYGFFRSVFGGKVVRDMVVQVPDLEASLRIVIPWDEIRARNLRKLGSVWHNETQQAEVTQQQHSNDEEGTIEDLTEYTIQTALNILDQVPEFRETVAYWREHERLGLAWRRYDRIEWLRDVNEQHMYAAWALRKTHELELRPKVHYPTFAPSPTARAQTLVEPPPIEGFLIRLTQHSGNRSHMGRLFYKQFYFMCHDNLLVFCKPHHATPPAFEKPFSMTEASGTHKFVHEFTPYPMKNGQIEWLDSSKEHNYHKLKELDEIALSEVYRKLYQILTSAGFIDLSDVDDVRPVLRNTTVDSNIGVGDGVNFNQSGRNDSTNYEDGVITNFDDDRVFELVLRSGLVIRLQAFNKITRDEWISRLNELRIYWRSRTESDARTLTALKADNLAQLHIDEEMESQIGEAASKWEALRGVADPEIYNVCRLGFCRSITIKGQLFYKLRRQATFQLSYVVICHGHLIIYEAQSRARTGVEVPKIYHKKSDVIPLRECYVYSGILTEADLANPSNSFTTSTAPGMYSLPRIYRDGTTASDDEYSRCFVVWRPKPGKPAMTGEDAAKAFRKQQLQKKKKLKRSKVAAVADPEAAGSGDVGANDENKFYRANKLGISGAAIMMMARSRMEKELWVSVLADEIGRIQDKCITHHVAC